MRSILSELMKLYWRNETIQARITRVLTGSFKETSVIFRVIRA